MDVAQYTQTGEKKGKATLPDSVFALPENRDLLAQAIRVLQGRGRRTIAHTKTRDEVRGGGRKPWQQKGTGRARHGSIRSPLWRGGGVTFGPTSARNFSLEMPRGMRSKALAVALSAKLRDKELAIIDTLALKEVKTKQMAQVRTVVAASAFPEAREGASMLMVTAGFDGGVKRASKNITKLMYRTAENLTALDVLTARNLLLENDAIAVLVKRIVGEQPQEKKTPEKKPAKKKKETVTTS